jgi:hypothetical protein
MRVARTPLYGTLPPRAGSKPRLVMRKSGEGLGLARRRLSGKRANNLENREFDAREQEGKRVKERTVDKPTIDADTQNDHLGVDTSGTGQSPDSGCISARLSSERVPKAPTGTRQRRPSLHE